MRIIALILFSFLCFTGNGQDTLFSNRAMAERQIIQLHDGYLVVRLKTYDKSIAAYRQAGKNKLANKLEIQYRAINLYLMKAFLENYNFSKVLFIKAQDSRKLVSEHQNIFLNSRLEIDPSIKMDDKPYFLAEYGTLMSNDRVSNNSFVVTHTEESSYPSTSAAIFIADTSLTQLKEPFPFFVLLNFNDYFEQAGGGGLKKQSTGRANDTLSTFSRKTIYRKSVERFNKNLIGYYVKISKKQGREVSDDPMDWEHHNPNGNVADKVKIVDSELSKIIDDSKFETK
jgi:hypothetical protein